MPSDKETPPAYNGFPVFEGYFQFEDSPRLPRLPNMEDTPGDRQSAPVDNEHQGCVDAQTLIDIETAHIMERQSIANIMERHSIARSQLRIVKWMVFMMVACVASVLGYALMVQYRGMQYHASVQGAYNGYQGMKSNLVGRQAYSYGGEHPTITITGLPSATTGHLTVNSTSTVPVTVSTDVAETTSVGHNITITETSSVVSTGIQTPQVINVTTTGTEIQTITMDSNVTITEVATNTSAGTISVTPFNPGPHSWINSTGSITHWVPATGTAASTTTVNGTVTSDADTIVPLTSTVNITVTLSPIPLWTTGGSDAMTGTVSNTTTYIAHSAHSTVPTSTITVTNSSEVNSTITTHGTVYTTVTETVLPSDNCTLTDSVTAFSTSGSDAVTGTPTSSTQVLDTITLTISEPESTSTTSNTFTSTETETVTPVYTVQMTKSVTEVDASISVYTVTTVNINTITVTIPQTTSTSSTEPCGEPETDTVTTTVISTVWGEASVTSSSVPASTETVSIGFSTTVTENAGESTTIVTSSHTCNESESTTGLETTITSYATLSGTLTRTTGGVDGMTASHSGANSSTVSIPCNTTDAYTLTVLPATSTSTEVPEVIISTIITTITTMTGPGIWHSRTMSAHSTTTTGMWHPESVNGTDMGNMTAMGNMTSNDSPETLPIGPAGANSTEPMVMNGTTMMMPMPTSSTLSMEASKTQTQTVISTTASSSAARRQPRVVEAKYYEDDVLPVDHCIVMFLIIMVVVPAQLYLFFW